MGNPCRHYYKNKYRLIGRDLGLNEKNNKVTLRFYELTPSEQINEKVVDIHFYSAPDVIMSHSWGGDNRDEFRRYFVIRLHDLVEIKREKRPTDDLLEEFDVECTYSRYEYVTITDQVEQITDVPVGKFYNLTKENAEHLLKMRERPADKKITVDGHGGHMCEAYFNDDLVVGNTIEEAVGLLVLKNQKHFGISVDILSCQTTAYERSCYGEKNDR